MALPEDTDTAIYVHAVFDTGLIIETFDLNQADYDRSVAQTLAHVQTSRPNVEWFQETTDSLRDFDFTDFTPIVNLSFVSARGPGIINGQELQYTLPSGNHCTLTFSSPAVYFHSFSAGVFSVKATLRWETSPTASDFEAIDARFLDDLGPMVEPNLTGLTAAFKKAAAMANVKTYDIPFAASMKPMENRNLLYWSHRIYVARVPDASLINLAAANLTPLMRPVDQEPVQNMALRTNRYIYLGSGRSLVCCSKHLGDTELASYARLVELRNYLWKVLYDLDRSLRNALSLSQADESPRTVRRLVKGMRSLEFRVQGILGELDPYKLTFDTEKMWLMRQLDRNWFLPDLVRSLKDSLSALATFYSYNEELTTREQEERLRSVLNLIGVVATAGAVTEIINYFDPLERLPALERGVIFAALMLLTVIIFSLGIVLARRARR